MTSRVLGKRSTVPSKMPTTDQIDLGKLAINAQDGKLFLKRDNGNGTFMTVEVGSPQAVASSLGLGAFAYGAGMNGPLRQMPTATCVFSTTVSRGCVWILMGMSPFLAISPHSEHLDHGISSIWGVGPF